MGVERFERYLHSGTFDFQISKFPESQTLRCFLQAVDFILAENIKLMDSDKRNCLQKG